VEDAGIAALSKLTGLTSLSLSGCVSLTETGLGHVPAFLSGLKSLRLGGCSRVATITDACLLHLRSLTQLTHLDLAGCLEISDSGNFFNLFQPLVISDNHRVMCELESVKVHAVCFSVCLRCSACGC